MMEMQSKRQKSDRGLGILTLAMFAAGIFLMVWGGNVLKKAYESSNWPSTPGTITSSYVEKRLHRSTGSSGSSGRTSRTSTSYAPRVYYRYTVAGKSRTGDQIAFGAASSGLESWADSVVKEYPKGNQVMVFYNPQDPGIAVLETGFNWGAFLLILGGVVFFGVGVLCYRSYQSKKAETLSSGLG